MSSFHDVGFLGRVIFFFRYFVYYTYLIVLFYILWIIYVKIEERDRNTKPTTAQLQVYYRVYLEHIIVWNYNKIKNKKTKYMRSTKYTRSDHFVALFLNAYEKRNKFWLVDVLNKWFFRPVRNILNTHR